LSEKVHSSFQLLSTAASDLNVVSDELGKSISEVDVALKKLNLGVTVWVPINSWDDPQDGSYGSEDIGYAKIGGRWGVGLRTVFGRPEWDEDNVEAWLFNDAPRSLRIEAIGKIPKLLEKLSEKAVETTHEIKNKLAEAQEVAAVVKKASEPPEVRRIIRRIPTEPSK
jgi:hypothetical protein